MTPVIFGKYEIGLFTDDGRYLSHGRKILSRRYIGRECVSILADFWKSRK